jgi:hypothetical protein
MVRECPKQNKDWEYTPGYIQGVLLASTAALYDERTKLINGEEVTTDPVDPQELCCRNIACRWSAGWW